LINFFKTRWSFFIINHNYRLAAANLVAKFFLSFNPQASDGAVFSVLAETDYLTMSVPTLFYGEWRKKVERAKNFKDMYRIVPCISRPHV